MSAKVTHFQPPSVQNYNAQYPEFAHRLIDTNPANKRGDRLRYWQDQGWEIAPYGNEGMKGNRDTGASSEGKAVHYRGLVLVRVPRAIADERNKFYRGKNERLLAASNTARQLASLARQRGSGDQDTSAFGTSTREVDRGGRRTVVHQSEFDSRSGKNTDSIMRDADPQALKELQERAEEQAETNRKLQEENAKLREEMEERNKRPGDRKRKSFPTA